MPGMATWEKIAAEAPELAELARGFFEERVHKTIATLRLDGSPRISGTEAKLIGGELYFGSMLGARKAMDLRRDPRFALHSGSQDPPDWAGDAKLSGRAEEISERARRARIFQAMGAEEVSPDSHLFRAEIAELSIVRLDESRKALVIEAWKEGEGVRRMTR